MWCEEHYCYVEAQALSNEENLLKWAKLAYCVDKKINPKASDIYWSEQIDYCVDMEIIPNKRHSINIRICTDIVINLPYM